MLWPVTALDPWPVTTEDAVAGHHPRPDKSGRPLLNQEGNRTPELPSSNEEGPTRERRGWFSGKATGVVLK